MRKYKYITIGHIVFSHMAKHLASNNIIINEQLSMVSEVASPVILNLFLHSMTGLQASIIKGKLM